MARLNFYLKGALSKSKSENLKKNDPKKYQDYQKKPLPLLLYCSFNSKRIQLPLGISIPPMAWNGQRIKDNRDFKQWTNHNATIIDTEQKVLDFLKHTTTASRRITKDDLKLAISSSNICSGKDFLSRNIIELFEEYTRSKKTSRGFNLAPATLKKYNTTKGHLIGFLNKSKIGDSIADINEHFLESFREYLYEVGCNDNTVCKYYKVLLELLRYLIRKDVNIDKALLSQRQFEYAPPVIIIELEEIYKLINFEFTDTSLGKIRDVFVFMCFTGQRYSDISCINWSDLTTNEGREVWVLNTKKTHETICVPITDYAEDIINKYRSSESPIPRFSEQYFNRRLKDMAKLANLNRMVPIENRMKGKVTMNMKPLYEVISSHIARKSFITNGMILGLSAEEIKTISGHKDDRSFRRYVDLARHVLKKAVNTFSRDNVAKKIGLCDV